MASLSIAEGNGTPGGDKGPSSVGEHILQSENKEHSKPEKGTSKAPTPTPLTPGSPKKRTKAQKKTAKKWRDKRESRMPEGAPAVARKAA